MGVPGLIREQLKGTLADVLGIEIVEASPERVVAQLAIRDELRTVGGALHGGTLMAFADTVGAVATVLNLPAGDVRARHPERRVWLLIRLRDHVARWEVEELPMPLPRVAREHRDQRLDRFLPRITLVPVTAAEGMELDRTLPLARRGPARRGRPRGGQASRPARPRGSGGSSGAG